MTHQRLGRLRSWRGPLEGRDSRGQPYWYWERQVPRIPDELLESVIYLYRDEQSAREGARAGGSGFLVHVASTERTEFSSLYAVTNSHVIREGRSPVIRLNAPDGTIAVLPVEADQWWHHPDGDDVAVCPIGLKPEFHKFYSLDVAMWLLARHEVEQYRIGPGEEAFFLGRFISHEGRQRNLPTARFGNISMMPGEPVRHPTRGIDQECFLVEARSLSGYSGSPVFYYIPPMTPQWDESFDDVGSPLRLHNASTLGLLGIDFMHFRDRQPVREPVDGKPLPEEWWVEQNSGIMGVVPAWKLAELLDDEELVRVREDREREWLADHGQKSRDIALDSVVDASTEYERFEDLARKIVRVPKREVDDQREG